MANIKYVVELTLDERAALLAKISKGTLAARANCKARILLKADKGPHGEGWTDRLICQSLETSPSTVARVRETFVLEGLEAVFARKRRTHPAIKRIFDGEAEARLIALACSEPPVVMSYSCWSSVWPMAYPATGPMPGRSKPSSVRAALWQNQTPSMQKRWRPMVRNAGVNSPLGHPAISTAMSWLNWCDYELISLIRQRPSRTD